MYRMNRVKVRSGRIPREGFLRITEYYQAKQEVGRCSNLGYTLESLWWPTKLLSLLYTLRDSDFIEFLGVTYLQGSSF